MLILPKHHWTQYLQGTYEPETFEKIKEIFKINKLKVFGMLVQMSECIQFS
tara:strand:- start:811 stop:963 length:153 start_codon:yes stop_codon:yes gene_type:complete